MSKQQLPFEPEGKEAPRPPLEFPVPDYAALAALSVDTTGKLQPDKAAGETDPKIRQLADEFAQAERDALVYQAAYDQITTDIDQLKKEYMDARAHDNRPRKKERKEAYVAEFRQAYQILLAKRRAVNAEFGELDTKKMEAFRRFNDIYVDENLAYCRQRDKLTAAKAKLRTELRRAEYDQKKLGYQIDRWHAQRKRGYAKPIVPKSRKEDIDVDYIVPSSEG
jgi:hypothetical protein